MQQIAQFFFYLHKELKFLVPAMMGYKATLNHVFALGGTASSANTVTSSISSIFEKNCLPREIRPPEWNLTQVLKSLICLPYEPLKLYLDKHQNWKT